MSASWTNDPLPFPIIPTRSTAAKPETTDSYSNPSSGKMERGMTMNLYIITFVCVVFVLITIVIVTIAERRRRQANEVVGMMARHFNNSQEFDAAMREIKPKMRDFVRLDSTESGEDGHVWWKDVNPLAVHAILPASSIKPTPTPPSKLLTGLRSWFRDPGMTLWAVNMIPPSIPRHGVPIPRGASQHELDSIHWTNQIINKELQDYQDSKKNGGDRRKEAVEKAEAFQVTVLIAMPDPRSSRSAASSKRSSRVPVVGEGECEDKSGDLAGLEPRESSRRTSSVGSRSDDSSLSAEPIPPFTLGVAMVDHR
ncbi:hypothetical protein CVT24_013112 [Panaeolus cyanescens]|uniref:Uncharacterized protein n=1 Tax=Panaeolus cyanescens TaxID=181874 RepID=A0A409YN44_9AGAR|nr:hypothetical protein CVT24_013112 [Panaeolus cyanescens]